MVASVLQPNIFELSSLVARENPTGKLAMPVDTSVLLYSRYKHVRGAPPVGAGRGVPLYRLRALDNLIERLISLRSNRPIVRNIADLSREEVDGLIEEYRKSVHREVSSESKVLEIGSVSNDLGLTLDIVA